MMMMRRVSKVVLSVEQSEGVGARVRRSIGRKEVLVCSLSYYGVGFASKCTIHKLYYD